MGAIIEISEALIEAAAKDATIANILNGMKYTHDCDLHPTNNFI